MPEHVNQHPNLTFSVGTHVVTLKDLIGPNGRTLHPRGSVGVVVRAPRDLEHSYRVKLPDSVEEALKPSELTFLAKFKEGEIGDSDIAQQSVRTGRLPMRDAGVERLNDLLVQVRLS